MKRMLGLATVVFAAATVSSTMAATVNLGTYQSTAIAPSDTRANGSATNSAVTIGGTPTVRLATTNGIDGNEKVAPFFYSGSTTTPIGTLGDLGRGGLTLDWLLESRGTNTAEYVANIAAIRLRVDGPIAGTIAEIIWEAPNQSPVPTFVQGQIYDNVDIGSGNFYARYLSVNYGEGSIGAVNPLTLSQLAAGGSLTTGAPIFTGATNVYGLQVSVGSAAGDYAAYVGDINATFVAVPEPTTLAALGGVALVALRRRRA